MVRSLIRALIPDRLLPRIGRLRDDLIAAIPPRPDYRHDGMWLYGRNPEFLRDPHFRSAYAKGMDSGHKILRPKGSRDDIHIEWRAHICCWAAWHAKQLEGDFVECGVNTGMMSLAVCNFIDFNATGRSFYLFDTFNGIPESQMSATERAARLAENEQYYDECFETAKRNFAPFPKAVLVRGMVPDSLGTVAIPKVCYLHIDMNIAYPERAAIEYFWERLSPGAPVVLDDYGFAHYPEQKATMDAFALSKSLKIATLPTGQGLLLKP